MRLSPKRIRERLGEKVDRAAAGSSVPAGSEPPTDTEQKPTTSARERGAMRRRARRLRRSREVLLLELGALVFESERRGRRDPNLVSAKVERLRAVDDEARALSTALSEDRPMIDLVSAGVAGTCETCGSLLSTDARFCSNCATPASPRARRQAAAANGAGAGTTQPTPGPGPVPQSAQSAGPVPQSAQSAGSPPGASSRPPSGGTAPPPEGR
ncbi:MAG: hypothetical protein ACR2LY_02790 [Thermoleophilaceae bacterium]